MDLLHFSDDPTIACFKPRAVAVPTSRPEGMAWLNGPLVWAIDAWHAPLYFFPRGCPRILMWPTQNTNRADLDHCWQGQTCRMIAYIETAWLERLQSTRLTRYELPAASFEDLGDAGMWVSRSPVTPTSATTFDDLPAALRDARVEVRAMESLAPLRGLWNTTMHVSGIRLRNAQGWAS